MMICPTCGSVGKPKTITRGSFLIEIVLWLFFFVPGIIYSLWRLTTRDKSGCRSCSNVGMIPLNTPQGMLLQQRSSMMGGAPPLPGYPPPAAGWGPP